MKILLFGGFLGSGKTTIIRAFIDAIVAGELGTIAIIENEIGEVGVDDTLLKEGSLEVKPLFGGCVCCEISGSLVVAVGEIHQQVNPDWLIIELTGVAELSNVKEVLSDYSVIELDTAAIAVVDGSRWHRLQIIGDFMRDQIMGCDMIIVNKLDLLTDDMDPEAIADDLMELTEVEDVVFMSADQDRTADSIGVLKAFFNLDDLGHDESFDLEVDDHDHDEDHDDDHDHDHEEHDHDHDERMVGAFSRQLTLTTDATADKEWLVEHLSSLFVEIGDCISQDEIIYGHVKGILLASDDSFVRYSLTHQGAPDILVSDGWASVPAGASGVSLTLNINSMLHKEEEIADIINPRLDKHLELFVVPAATV